MPQTTQFNFPAFEKYQDLQQGHMSAVFRLLEICKGSAGRVVIIIGCGLHIFSARFVPWIVVRVPCTCTFDILHTPSVHLVIMTCTGQSEGVGTQPIQQKLQKLIPDLPYGVPTREHLEE
jgi:hypothetical protein